MLNCRYANQCSGCEWLHLPLSEQHALKLADLESHWRALTRRPLPDLRTVALGEGGLRERVDLISDRRGGGQRLGLFDRDHRAIVDLESCPQLTEPLLDWLEDFRKTPLPVERGSVRLRVAPDGTRGAWLDLANIDVKSLLDERTTLTQLRTGAIIEIGQRRKRLIERDEGLKLSDPVFEPWFATWLGPSLEKQTPLYCTIGSFTQPGLKANYALVAEVMNVVRASGARRAIEFGAGIGNFTLPLASVLDHVTALEIDALALSGLTRSLEVAGLSEKVAIQRGDFQAERPFPIDNVDLVLVDPPRSGLKRFLDPILRAKPRHFVYVSCFGESFAIDAASLLESGYGLMSISMVDQFPQSRHYELVAHFTCH